jgi:hypothetical protein
MHFTDDSAVFQARKHERSRFPRKRRDPRPAVRYRRKPIPNNRLRLLAAQIYDLGPAALAYLFAELADGAPPLPRIKRYADLSSKYAAFVRALSSDEFLMANEETPGSGLIH